MSESTTKAHISQLRRAYSQCHAVQNSGCDEAVEKEREIASAGGEWIDGEWFEYDPDTYWLPEEE